MTAELDWWEASYSQLASDTEPDHRRGLYEARCGSLADAKANLQQAIAYLREMPRVR
jgi:hypothetical protein